MRHRASRTFFARLSLSHPARRRALVAAALTVTATLTGVGVAVRHDDTAPSAARTPVTAQLGTPSATIATTATTATTRPVSPSKRVSRSGDRKPGPVATPEPSPTETSTPSTLPEVSETPELGTATTSTKPTPSASVPSPVDESAPDTSASTSAVDGDSWTVAVSADEPASYECSLDGGSYQACGGSTTFTGLERGRHSLTARATDEDGNTDPTPAELTTKVTGSH